MPTSPWRVFAPLLLSIGSSPFPAHAAPDFAIGLIAHSGGKIHWQARGAQEGGTCSISVDRKHPSIQRRRELSSQQCASLKDLMKVAKTEVLGTQSSPAPPAPSTLLDEPRFDLVIDQKRYPVDFRAPKECQVSPQGQLNCRLIPLSNAQLLLIRLRAEAKGLLGEQPLPPRKGP